MRSSHSVGDPHPFPHLFGFRYHIHIKVDEKVCACRSSKAREDEGRAFRKESRLLLRRMLAGFVVFPPEELRP